MLILCNSGIAFLLKYYQKESTVFLNPGSLWPFSAISDIIVPVLRFTNKLSLNSLAGGH
jgi:hypothetical protein